MKFCFIAILLLVMGCAPVRIQPRCVAIRDWSRVEQNELAYEIEKLSPKSLLIIAMMDYYKIRSQLRVCKNEY
jgi:hypothetical protein